MYCHLISLDMKYCYLLRTKLYSDDYKKIKYILVSIRFCFVLFRLPESLVCRPLSVNIFFSRLAIPNQICYVASLG